MHQGALVRRRWSHKIVNLCLVRECSGHWEHWATLHISEHGGKLWVLCIREVLRKLFLTWLLIWIACIQNTIRVARREWDMRFKVFFVYTSVPLGCPTHRELCLKHPEGTLVLQIFLILRMCLDSIRGTSMGFQLFAIVLLYPRSSCIFNLPTH